MSGYINNFDDGEKNKSFNIENNNLCSRYIEIWNKIEKEIVIRFHSQPIYDDKYKKTNVKKFNGVIKTLFPENEIPKERNHYSCNSAICVDFIMKIDKKNYPQVYLEQRKYKIQKRILVNFFDADLDLNSDDSDDSECNSIE